MRTEQVINPNRYDGSELVAMIEATPDAFTVGRRNNDMVNWFLAKRIADLEAGEDSRRLRFQMVDDYIADFQQLRLSTEQRESLASWSDQGHPMTPERKIERLGEYYGSWQLPALYNLWLPMDYVVPGAQPEGQTQLHTEG